VALDDYKRKRDFSKSPEPAGDQEKARKTRKGKPLYFCVQKHLASHLHYDFRIEHDGVLMSWAVPKGPSLDPKVKRLAMRVEDHPIEYGSFEGVIPDGYGAGIVMLWDSGTWAPESEDIDKALAKGDLKFTLDGYKLKGSWVLVRTRGYGSSRSDGPSKSWLLIKHRDDWSGDLDITEFAPRSVKSDLDFPEILAEDNPEIWQSHKPAAGGEAGDMLREIIEQAAALKAGRSARPARSTRTSKAKKSNPAEPARTEAAAPRSARATTGKSTRRRAR